ncbi:MAG: GIY-YIG nuclease family protein [Candidatus Marinimicrobia bacterium]|nr:GIY-YIG nuclease family protein [Candidatus Neomarinimicrobiota bacterium]
MFILSNKMRTVVSIGMTNDLEKRMFEHKTGHGSTFSKKYNVTDLLYYEEYPSVLDAITREKQLKNWISSMNIIQNTDTQRGPEINSG